MADIVMVQVILLLPLTLGGPVLSAVVYLQAPRRALNRLLAGAVLMTWIDDGMRGVIMLAQWSGAPHQVVLGLDAARWPAVGLLAPIYLAFVGRALRTPLVSWIRSRAATIVLIGYAALATPIALLAILANVNQTATVSGLEGAWTAVVLLAFWNNVNAVVAMFSLVAAFVAFRGELAGSLGRRRAAAYLAAFGFRDVSWLLWGARSVIDPVDSTTFWWTVYGVAIEACLLLFLFMLTYGFFRLQLLDIDLHIRWVVSRATMAGVVVAAFFMVSEAAVEALGDRTGSAYVGIAGVGLVLVLLAPLRRAAEGVAARLVPAKVTSGTLTPEQSVEVYREQLEIAWSDGRINSKERNALAAMRKRLLIPADVALGLEEYITGGAANPSG